MRKTMIVRMIAMAAVLAILFLLVSCKKEEVSGDKTGIVEAIKDVNPPMPSFPDNPFEALHVKEPAILPSAPEDYQFVSVRMFRFGIDPEVIEVKKGEKVKLVVTSADVGHGFALPEFGINQPIPPEESVEITFVPDISGEFEYFESVYCGKGWKEMKGRLIVKE
ncbi:TPA: hypothetical protein HA265_00670 [Candidatus Woesearchaeota archaeon]|nr:hypothetical protein [Candidatus Woesearchaeota archaeon]